MPTTAQRRVMYIFEIKMGESKIHGRTDKQLHSYELYCSLVTAAPVIGDNDLESQPQPLVAHMTAES